MCPADLVSSFKCLGWELVARWAAGRWEAQLCLMCSKASNSVYADRGEQQERPFRDSHTRGSFSPRMRVCQSATRHPLSEREDDGLDPFCTRLAAISEDSLSFSNTARVFSRFSFPSSRFPCRGGGASSLNNAGECREPTSLIKKKTQTQLTRMGYEPTHAKHNGLAVHRLNHSATLSKNAQCLFTFCCEGICIGWSCYDSIQDDY